ncbi:MAG TPA: hypothetical protein LFV90_00615 [Rickettsia endosymbiont of Columbicola hoogstraali]|nr:hypothetical protein [Rickettsia endosymbiont of Columbicola hoogstraali]
MEEVKKNNMVMNTQISRGNYWKEVKASDISAGVAINSNSSIDVEIEFGKKPLWLSMLEARQGKHNVNTGEIKRESKGWDRKTRTLTPQAQVVIGTAVTAATVGVGSTIGAGGIGVGGAVGTGVSSAIAAGVSGFSSSVVIGAANNGGEEKQELINSTKTLNKIGRLK